jgi:hypothetical protein
MKTLNSLTFCICFFLFLVLNFSVHAQTKTETYNYNGLNITTFTTKTGKVKVYLPDLTANQTVSGTIKLEANSTKTETKDLEQLKKKSISIANQSISLQVTNFKINLGNNLKIILLNEKGDILGQSQNITTSKVDSNCTSTCMPSYIVVGYPARIKSNYLDGNLTNNSVYLNNQPLNIIAESETDLFFETPENIKGQQQLQFINDGTKIEETINVLQLDVSAKKLNLLKSETTTLNISISGLDNLDTAVPLTITNKSPSNIILDEGNNQQHIINPEQNATNGNFNITQNIQAIQNGGFSISVNIIPPELSNPPSNQILCNCWIENFSYLISPEACVELGGSCTEPLDEVENTDEDEHLSIPYFSTNFPVIISAENQLVALQIKDYDKNNCVAVNFSYKPIDSENWKIIGFDTMAEDGFFVSWEPPTNQDGIVEIQTQVVNKNNVVAKKISSVFLNTTTITFENDSLNTVFTITDSEIRRAQDKARKTDEEIDDLEDEIFEKWKKRYDAEDKKKEHEDDKNKLITIDKVLDSIPKTYQEALKKILDSLANLEKQLPEIIDGEALQKAVNDAQARVDACKDRLEKLKKEQQELEEERDRLKAETDAALEEMDALMKANGMTGGYGYHADGLYWYGYVGDENSNGDIIYSEKYYQLKSKLRGLKKQYLKTLKRLNELPDEISEAEKDCEDLNNALAKAKAAKENADLHAAAKLEADDICRQIKRLLIPLWQWCVKNPDSCNFREAIEELMEKCPKDSSQLDDFWNDFNDLVSRKKEQEDAFGKAAKADQKEIDGIDDDIAGLKDQIKALEDKKRKELEAADALRKQQAAEAAEAKAAAEARARERKKQKENDAKIKELIKKAKSDDAGTDAFLNLLKGMGLDVLDEATGDLKFGKILGGLLVIKNMPDCVCPLLEALKDAIAEHKSGRDPFVYVNDYISKWKDCANIPSISSIMEGSQQLTEAIKELNNEQCDRAIKALEQAIRLECKK